MKPEKHEKLTRWFAVKEEQHNLARIPKFKDGEVWWTAVGENVGIEINGKGKGFSRPVLVLRRLTRFGFVGIPFTSQMHEGKMYVEILFQGKKEWAVLGQVRTFSSFRLYNKMGEISKGDMRKIKNKLNEMLK